MPSTTPGCGPANCTITLIGDPENTINTTVANKISSTTFKVCDVSYKFNGTVSSSNATGNVSSALDTMAGIVGTIIIDIIALIFIWVAFMAAKWVSKVASAAFEPFEALGKKVGGMAASLPKYAPILPGGMSVNSATKAVNMAETMKENADQKRFEKTGIYKMLWWDKLPNQGEMKKAAEIMNTYKDKAFSTVSNDDSTRLWEILRNNASKDGIEHEKVYTEYMKNLKEITNGSVTKMDTIMKAQWFNDEQTKVIAGKIANGKYDMEADKDLLAAWKATAGKSSNGSGTNASGTNFTIEKTDWKPINITITNGSTTNKITIANLKNASIDDLAKTFKWSNIDSNNLKEILQAATNTTNPDDVIKKIKELEEAETKK